MDYLITVDLDLVDRPKLEWTEEQINEQLLRTFVDEREINKEARTVMQAMMKTRARTKLDILAEKYVDCKRWSVFMVSTREELSAIKREMFGSDSVEIRPVL